MATKKHNLIVITASAIIAIAFAFFQWKKHHSQSIESNVYKTGNGWGYDIMVDDKLLIRQVTVPVIAAKRVFATKEQAEKTAELVINKLKTGQPPTLTKFDLEKILPVYKPEHGQ